MTGPDPASILARAVDKAREAAAAAGPQFRPATVSAFDPRTGTAAVLLDGATLPITVESIVPGWYPRGGARGLVMFSGAKGYLAGRLGPDVVMPICSLVTATAVSVVSGGPLTYPVWDTPEINTDGMWDATSGTPAGSVMTCRLDGWYWVGFDFSFPFGTSGQDRAIGVLVNGVRKIGTEDDSNAISQTSMHVGSHIELKAGDQFQAWCYQSGPTNPLNCGTTSQTGDPHRFQAVWVRPRA
jgi:hypothetical protein